MTLSSLAGSSSHQRRRTADGDVMTFGHGREVTHLMQSGTLSPHQVSEGVRQPGPTSVIEAARLQRPPEPDGPPPGTRTNWAKIWSTKALESLDREVKRRTEVVVILPHLAALLDSPPAP